jgi:ATP-binding cassette subfamily B protein
VAVGRAGRSHRSWSDLQLYARLLGEARCYWLHIVALFLLGLVSTGTALLTPLPLKIAVDNVVGSQPLPGVIAAVFEPSKATLMLLVAVLVVVVHGLDHLQRLATYTLGTNTGERLALEFRAKLFRHAQRLSFAYHDRRGTADAIYRIQWDAAAIQWIAVYGVTPFISAALTLAGMFYVIGMLSWPLALVALAVAPVVSVVNATARRDLRRRWTKAKDLESSAYSMVHEVLIGLRIVKAFGQEEREEARFLTRFGDSTRARTRVALVEGSFDLLVGLTIAVGTGVVLFVGLQQVQAGTLSLGGLVLVIGYLARLYLPFQEISKSLVMLQASLASAERAYALLDEAPDVVERPHARPLVRAAGAVAFRNVSFAYAGHARVLHDLSFDVPPGTRLGIMGATGAGKTTLVSLLSRFYDPTAGQILLDGIDLREYRLQHLRRQFAIVLQEPVLFSATVAENIAYARPDASEQDLVESARSANAHDFIAALPDGYQTLVGERGMRLSGGERQRIALARAFLKDAPILILDEPTSSIDVETEAVILEAMWRLMQGRTAFLIAHRITTLAPCDACLELEGGRLARMAPLNSPAGALRVAPHGRSGLARS